MEDLKTAATPTDKCSKNQPAWQARVSARRVNSERETRGKGN